MKKLEKQFYMISSDLSAKRIEQLASIKKISLAIMLGGYVFNLLFSLIFNHIFFERPIDFIFLLKFATHLLGITLIYLLIVSLILFLVKIYRKHWPSFITASIIITVLTFLTISFAHYKRYYENKKIKTEVSSLKIRAFSLLQEKKDNHMNALDLLNKAIELDPNDAINYNNRGVAWYKLGQYEQAIKDFNGAIHLDPNDSYAYNNRGNAFYELGKTTRACNDWRKACYLGNCDGLNWAKEKGFCK